MKAITTALVTYLTVTVAAAPCSLCLDNEFIVLPLQLVTIPGYPEMDCATLDIYAPVVITDDTSQDCIDLREGLSATCGCTSSEDEGEQNNSALNDETATGSTTQPPAREPSNIVSQLNLFGTSSLAEVERLYNFSLAGTILSMFGALWMLQDSTRNKRNRSQVYNQIVASMAVFDFICALAFSLGTMPMASGNAFDLPGERGTDTTCKVQGFFIQLGLLTSLFFNVSLSTYYVMVIIRRSPSSRIKQARKYLLGLPILAGVIVAGAAVPFVTGGISGCVLLPPVPKVPPQIVDAIELPKTWGPYLGLMLMPALSCLLYTTLAQLKIYLYVRQVERKQRTWTSRLSSTMTSQQRERSSVTLTPAPPQPQQNPKRNANRKSNKAAKLRKEVFWQSAFYLSAIYMTWIVCVTITIDIGSYLCSHYGLWQFVFFILPLQGFLNACVYFKPRASLYLAKLSACAQSRWAQWRSDRASSNVQTGNGDDDVPSSVSQWQEIIDFEPVNDLVQANEESSAIEQDAVDLPPAAAVDTDWNDESPIPES